MVTPQDNHSHSVGALKAYLWGPEGKRSEGDLLPLRWDYFYAGNLDFLAVFSLRIPIFT